MHRFSVETVIHMAPSGTPWRTAHALESDHLRLNPALRLTSLPSRAILGTFFNLSVL